jgi:hypothetical protein
MWAPWGVLVAPGASVSAPLLAGLRSGGFVAAREVGAGTWCGRRGPSECDVVSRRRGDERTPEVTQKDPSPLTEVEKIGWPIALVLALLVALCGRGVSSSRAQGSQAQPVAPCYATTVTINGATQPSCAPMRMPDQSAPITIASGTGYVEMVAGIAGQAIRVYGWDATVSGSTTLVWGYSTSTSCTSVTALTGAYVGVTGAELGVSNGWGARFQTPVGDTLCLDSTSSVSVQGVVSYQQSQ